MSTIEVRVARKACEAEGICSYELVRADGAPLPPFEAGAHIDVHLDGGLVRQYSLCNAPGNPPLPDRRAARPARAAARAPCTTGRHRFAC
jgi:ferredoxin-NADP reductase